VPLDDRRGDAVDGLAVADVAGLPFSVELLGQWPEALLAARDQDALPASGG
jgi:hypothetical protein